MRSADVMEQDVVRSAGHGARPGWLGGRAAPLSAAVVIAALAVLCAASGPALPETVAPTVIPNYWRLRADVASSGRPTDEGLARLRELGFRVVVDLRTESEGTEAERQAVTAAGLRYVSVPVTPRTFSRADARAVGAVLDEEGRGPVLIHCATGNRVGAVWTILELDRGVSYEDALAEGRRIGLRSEDMVDAVRRVAGHSASH